MNRCTDWQKLASLGPEMRILPKTKVNEIAVGTIIADRPPHGPGRALISASGSYLG